MRFILQYPDLHRTDGDLLDAGSIAEVARAAEAAGFAGFALSEHPVPSATWLRHGGHQTLDPFIALGHAAAVTTGLRLLTYLAVLPYRNAFLLAKSAATLELLSGGRFVLGAGAGYLKSEYHAAGVAFEERNHLVDEVLDVLPLAWSGRPCSYTGRHFDARDVQCLPTPRTPIPIWLGGNSSTTLHRVAARAQGWMPLLTSPELASTIRSPWIGSLDDLATRVDILRELAGDRFDSLDVVPSYRDASAFDSGGTADRHQDTFGRLAALGATCVVVSPPWQQAPALLDAIATFGARFLTRRPTQEAR